LSGYDLLTSIALSNNPKVAFWTTNAVAKLQMTVVPSMSESMSPAIFFISHGVWRSRKSRSNQIAKSWQAVTPPLPSGIESRPELRTRL
jgi:hypothetical protein